MLVLIEPHRWQASTPRLPSHLSDYQSAEMQIRFHCYDTDNMGLSYYWQIDNLEILGSGSNNITGYNVYRNGIKIATNTTTEYVDPAPLDGTNTYVVSATGSFGGKQSIQ